MLQPAVSAYSVVQIASAKTSPLQAGGAFMLGGEQDCYGGCTDAGQAFYGLMDEVRKTSAEDELARAALMI